MSWQHGSYHQQSYPDDTTLRTAASHGVRDQDYWNAGPQPSQRQASSYSPVGHGEGPSNQWPTAYPTVHASVQSLQHSQHCHQQSDTHEPWLDLEPAYAHRGYSQHQHMGPGKMGAGPVDSRQQDHPQHSTQTLQTQTGMHSAAATQEDGLRAVTELPKVFHGLFPFRYFNPVQSDCFDSVFNTNTSLVVAAPTGSGKTGVMELATIRLLAQQLPAPDAVTLDRSRSAGKVLYLAPMRALVQEKARDWQERYGSIGVSVIELSSDREPDRAELDCADILCSTPEKFDACTRKLNEGGSASFFGDISLVLIDEVHLLGEPGRGAALEAGVVSRIRMVSQWPSMRMLPIAGVRFVAVSATIPNVADIAAWLGAPVPGGLHVYGEEMRPCKLRTVIRSYNPSKNDFLFERKLNEYVGGIIAEFSSGKPTLIFCSSRKGTLETANHLARLPAGPGRPSAFVKDPAHAARLKAAAASCTAKGLKANLELGVGFHHAAMDASERELVEKLFLAQDLPVLCATSTLAMGVNLPAHLVILKGTRRYCGAGDMVVGGQGAQPQEGASSGYREYDKNVCLQMVGRAGRPQFDKEGVAVIMTQKETAARYQNLLSGAEEVESGLKATVAEHLAAEISLKTIRDITQAIQWLKTTFLFVRVQRKPSHYGIPPAALHSLDTYLRDTLVLDNIKILVKHGLVTTDEDGFSLEAMEPCRIMAHHYIALDTMITLMQVPPSAGMPQLLNLAARAAELQNIHIRRGEKKTLSDIHSLPLDSGGPRYPLLLPNGKRKPKIMTNEEKIYLLLNEALSDTPSDRLEYSLKQEQEQIVRVTERVVTAMARYYQLKGLFAASCNALQLQKALRYRMWPDTQQQCRQLPNVGRLTASRLAAAGLGSLRELAAADARRIEAAAQRFYPFGDSLLREVTQSLPPRVSFSLVKQHVTHGGQRLDVQLQLQRAEEDAALSDAGKGRTTSGRLLVGSPTLDKLLVQQHITVETFKSPMQISVSMEVPEAHRATAASRRAAPGSDTPHADTAATAPGPTPLRLVACVMLDRSLGLDTVQVFTLGDSGARQCRGAAVVDDGVGRGRGAAVVDEGSHTSQETESMHGRRGGARARSAVEEPGAAAAARDKDQGGGEAGDDNTMEVVGTLSQAVATPGKRGRGSRDKRQVGAEVDAGGDAALAPSWVLPPRPKLAKAPALLSTAADSGATGAVGGTDVGAPLLSNSRLLAASRAVLAPSVAVAASDRASQQAPAAGSTGGRSTRLLGAAVTHAGHQQVTAGFSAGRLLGDGGTLGRGVGGTGSSLLGATAGPPVPQSKWSSILSSWQQQTQAQWQSDSSGTGAAVATDASVECTPMLGGSGALGGSCPHPAARDSHPALHTPVMHRSSLPHEAAGEPSQQQEYVDQTEQLQDTSSEPGAGTEGPLTQTKQPLKPKSSTPTAGSHHRAGTTSAPVLVQSTLPLKPKPLPGDSAVYQPRPLPGIPPSAAVLNPPAQPSPGVEDSSAVSEAAPLSHSGQSQWQHPMQAADAGVRAMEDEGGFSAALTQPLGGVDRKRELQRRLLGKRDAAELAELDIKRARTAAAGHHGAAAADDRLPVDVRRLAQHADHWSTQDLPGAASTLGAGWCSEAPVDAPRGLGLGWGSTGAAAGRVLLGPKGTSVAAHRKTPTVGNTLGRPAAGHHAASAALPLSDAAPACAGTQVSRPLLLGGSAAVRPQAGCTSAAIIPATRPATAAAVGPAPSAALLDSARLPLRPLEPNTLLTHAVQNREPAKTSAPADSDAVSSAPAMTSDHRARVLPACPAPFVASQSQSADPFIDMLCSQAYMQPAQSSSATSRRIPAGDPSCTRGAAHQRKATAVATKLSTQQPRVEDSTDGPALATGLELTPLRSVFDMFM